MLTDKEEIIFKYSAKEKFASNELMASNVAQALGIEAAVLAGSAVVGAGAGAAGMFGFGGAGVGALAGLGLSGPPGWIVLGAIALIGTLAWAISSAVRRTDDNIEDLVDRLEDLDSEGTAAETAIKSWVRALNSYRQVLTPPQIPALGQDNNAIVEDNLKRVMVIKSVVGVLEDIYNKWPLVKAAVKDWKFLGSMGDVGQAEVTIKQTYSSVKSLYEQLQKQAQKDAKETLDKIKKFIPDENYLLIAQEVLKLYNTLTKAFDGIGPKFDTSSEKIGYEFAKEIVVRKGDVDSVEINKNIKHVINLRDLMRDGLKQVTSKRRANLKPPMSKRALTLGDGTRIDFSKPIEDSKPSVKKPIKKKKQKPDRFVVAIQRFINILRGRYLLHMSKISEDGMYGPETAGYLSAIMVKSDKLRKALNSKGLYVRDVQDYKRIRNNIGDIKNIHSALSEVIYDVTRKPISKRDDEVGIPGIVERDKIEDKKKEKISPEGLPIGICPLDKPGLNTYEVDQCLRIMPVTDPSGKKTNAYSFLKFYAGANTAAERAAMLYDAFGAGSVGGLPLAAKWTDYGIDLVKYVVERTSGRRRGPYRFY